ncbi:MAG TPA: heparinase II/III family protein, partial [Gaiellaceae bacterium]|nr:heparinase II/III family protein [Gaiellaceae bacterium]
MASGAELAHARERRHNSRSGWYWRRLQAMTTAEIGQRVAIALRHRNDDVAWRLAQPVWRRSWYPALDGEDPQSQAPFLATGNADELRRADPDSCARIVERAEAVLAGRFAFLGYEKTALRRPLDFTLDIANEFRWPAVHAKRLDYRTAGGDPKWIWELNRCQHVTLLVAAWLLTAREEFARCAADDMLEWIRANPPGRGIAWANGYEAGLRAISLSIAADALRDFGALGVDARRTLLLSLWQHRRWIERDPSLGSSANNHRIGELVGLLAIGVLAPHLPDAGRWRSFALRALESEADRQILPDGGNAEQAFSYSVFVCDLLLVAAALLRQGGLDRSAAIEAALARAASAFAAQMSASEPPPRYGDSGGDRAVVLDGEEQRDARRVCAGITALTGSPEARLVASDLDVTARWLFGEEGARRFAETVPAAPPRSCAFPETGLVVFR